MKDLIGKNLADWRLEIWYELRLSTNERGAYDVAGYFTDKNLANSTGKNQAFYGSDGKVAEVLVLTKDGTTGFIVNGEQIKLREQATIRAEAIARAKSKLTAEDKKLLGIE